MKLADLRALVAQMPDAGTVPIVWVREQLGALEIEEVGDPELFNVAGLAKRWHRGASTVRGMLESGEVAGAYRLRGREWRVPRDAVLGVRGRPTGDTPANAADPGGQEG